MAHAEQFSDHRLHLTRAAALLHLRSAEQQAADEVKLDRCAGCGVESKPLGKAPREKTINDGRVAISDNIFLGNENIVEHDTEIRLVEAAGVWVIKWRTDLLGQIFIRVTPDKLN